MAPSWVAFERWDGSGNEPNEPPEDQPMELLDTERVSPSTRLNQVFQWLFAHGDSGFHLHRNNGPCIGRGHIDNNGWDGGLYFHSSVQEAQKAHNRIYVHFLKPESEQPKGAAAAAGVTHPAFNRPPPPSSHGPIPMLNCGWDGNPIRAMHQARADLAKASLGSPGGPGGTQEPRTPASDYDAQTHLREIRKVQRDTMKAQQARLQESVRRHTGVQGGLGSKRQAERVADDLGNTRKKPAVAQSKNGTVQMVPGNRGSPIA